jgi:sulfur carrier protein
MPLLIVNGETRKNAAALIPELLRGEAVPEDHWKALAVAVNGRVVTRDDWAATSLKEGDRIDIVKPFAGG